MNFVRVSILVSVVAFVGCGPSGPAMGPVKGKVTLGGKPYTNGIVTFTPEGGGPSGTGATNSEGIYELFSAGVKGAKVGKNKVSITTVVAVPESKKQAEVRSDDPSYSAFGNASDYKAAEKQKEPIPAKYNTNSELIRDVTSGANTFDFDL